MLSVPNTTSLLNSLFSPQGNIVISPWPSGPKPGLSLVFQEPCNPPHLCLLPSLIIASCPAVLTHSGPFQPCASPDSCRPPYLLHPAPHPDYTCAETTYPSSFVPALALSMQLPWGNSRRYRCLPFQELIIFVMGRECRSLPCPQWPAFRGQKPPWRI